MTTPQPATARGAFRAATLLTLASVALSPFALRLAALHAHDLGFAPADLSGLTSDTIAALLFCAVLMLVARGSRIAAALLVVPWTLGQYANFEHVRELGTLATIRDAAYLADPTFVGGSALSPAQPVLLVILLLAGPALAWFGLERATFRSAGIVAGVAALGLVAQALWPFSDAVATWRQVHFLHNDGRLAVLAALSPEPEARFFADPPSAMLDLVPELAANLDGEPIVPLARPDLNVLLIVLESVSGSYLPTLAADQAANISQISMPELDALARDNLAWSAFFTHQRKTNRGEYAILCGELPNLGHGIPKMTDAAENGWRTCLPEILGNAGYTTAYLQAAPLAFMLKDQFMPSIGFDRVHGRDWFGAAYARSVWGIDDRAFFEQAVPLVEELEAAEAPWFLTLLTVGTHHPFVVPSDFRRDVRPDGSRALLYLDAAVSAFVNRLQELGVRDDTLILLTSDESAGVRSADDVLTRILSQNWGFLIALLPETGSQRITAPFAQMDLALSILDFVGLADRGGALFGRSVFRRYDRERSLFFANTNHGAAGSLSADGRVLVCTDGFRRCRAFQAPGGRPFDPARRVEPARNDEVDALRQLVRRSVRTPGTERASRNLPLLSDPVFVAEGPGDQLIHGGQFVSLEPGNWIEVELHIEASGPGARVEIEHILRLTGADQLSTWRIPLADGQTLHLQYTYAPQEPIDEVGARSIVRLLEGERLRLDFGRSRMTLHSAGEPPAPGIQVQRREITPQQPRAAPDAP